MHIEILDADDNLISNDTWDGSLPAPQIGDWVMAAGREQVVTNRLVLNEPPKVTVWVAPVPRGRP